MLEREEFYDFVYGKLLAQTAKELNGVPPVDKHYALAVKLASRYQIEDIHSIFARKVFNGILIHAIDYYLYKDGIFWFVVAGEERQIVLDDLWQEYASVPALGTCSKEDLDIWLKLRLAMAAIPPNTAIREDLPGNFQEQLKGCTPEQSVAVCLSAFQRKQNLTYFILALSHVFAGDIDVPWMCITADMSSKDIYYLFSALPCCKVLDDIYQDKGMDAVVRKILSVAACMPISTWSGDYVEAFNNTWQTVEV